MPNEVKFINKYVRIMDEGIELIFVQPYKLLLYDQIEEIKIGNGFLIKNRMPIRINGITVILASI
jgi:hypothetical protein